METKVKNKWLNFITLYLGAVILSMSQLKITPIFNEILSELGVTATQTSLLMSVFTFSALFLAIPAGKLISKYGVKKISVLIMLFLFSGNLIGIFANSYLLLLISRIIEGISFAMINMVGIIFINNWFKDGGAGIAIGIFGTFSATASLIAMNIYRPIYEMFGLKSVWIITALLAGIVTLLYGVVFKDIKEEFEEEGTLKEAISNKFIWFLALAMGCMSLVLFTFLAIYPSVFMDIQGLLPDKANSYAGFFGLFGVPFGLIAGVIIDKTNRPGLLAFVTNILIVLSTFFVIKIKPELVLIQVFILSAAISMNSTAINISIQKSVNRPALLSYSLSLLYLFYYIGTFIGPPMTTKIMEISSWANSLTVLSGISLLGSLCLLYYVLGYERKLTNK